MRRPASCLASSRSRGWSGWNALGSSLAPSRSGTMSSSQAAPGPQASALMPAASVPSTRPPPGPPAGLPTEPPGGPSGASRKVAGPAGVSDVRQMTPLPSMRIVGSPGPRRCTRRVRRALSGNGACHSRLSRASWPSSADAVRATSGLTVCTRAGTAALSRLAWPARTLTSATSLAPLPPPPARSPTSATPLAPLPPLARLVHRDHRQSGIVG